jgi:hypothetical protein
MERKWGKEREAALTMSVPAAGRHYYGLSPAGSYAAVKRGEIVVIKVGRLLRVPIAAMDHKMLTAGNV